MISNNYVIQQAINEYNSNIVKIEKENISSVAWLLDDKETQYTPNSFLMQLPENEAIKYMLALNSINYQFWDIHEDEFKRYKHNGIVGANAMFEQFPSFYYNMSNKNSQLIDENILIEYFGDIPQVVSRVEILRESMSKEKSNLLVDLILEYVNENNVVDVDLAKQIASYLPLSYYDNYLKKIQLGLYDLYFLLKNNRPSLKLDLTIAADYQIPKVLEGLGLISYNKSLKDKIDNMILISPGSDEEKAIRAASILACNEVVKKYKVSVPILDKKLWLIRNNFKDKKFHLTKTTKY